MKKPLVKAFRIIGIVLLVLVVVVGIVLARVGTIIKTSVNTFGPQVLGVPVSLEQASFYPLKGEIRMRNLVIGSPDEEKFGTNAIFRLGGLSVDLAMKDILAGNVHIRDITVTGPEVWYQKTLTSSNIGRLLEILEENNIAVVGDDLAQETRQYRTAIPEKGGTPIRRLAKQWMNRKGCCLAHEDFKQRGEMLAEMCKETGASGVMYCLMKFCDPEEYDYPICRSALQDVGIPTLMLEIDQQSTSCEQARTRVQTFADMI